MLSFSDDFRGTKESLKKLIEEDRHHRTLLQDIWRFYRSERIYLVQILKEIVSHSVNLDHPHQKELDQLMDQLNGRDQFKRLLLEQLKEVIREPIPCYYQSHGGNVDEHQLHEWARFNLREQSELLQIFLLFLQTYGNKYNTADILIEFMDLCHEHGFGHRQKSQHLISEVSSSSGDLSLCIGYLEALILINLIDLPTLTVDREQHCIWASDSDDDVVHKIDKAISGLGSRREHGPIMLSWMLAHYLTDSDSLSKFYALGERAIQLDVVSFLAQMVENPVIGNNQVICNIAKGICYAASCVLVTAFEPRSMGLTAEVQKLAKSLFSHEAIALDFWRQGYEVRAFQFRLICNFPGFQTLLYFFLVNGEA